MSDIRKLRVGKQLLERQKRRDRVGIIASILEFSKEGALKTQIMYRAGLSFSQINDYLIYLQDNGLIAPSVVEDKEGYIITKKGAEFLKKHHELTKLLEVNERIRKS
jgi:predicted transcriptional regulator